MAATIYYQQVQRHGCDNCRASSAAPAGVFSVGWYVNGKYRAAGHVCPSCAGSLPLRTNASSPKRPLWGDVAHRPGHPTNARMEDRLREEYL